MKDKVDADKVSRHIQYTRHWLEKAEQDFNDKKFANGSVILNLARAELTAAWEEALQLKTRIVSSIPNRKQNFNWKSVSSVSLLASGFIIAVIMIQFTSNPIPRTERQAQQRPAISENATIAETMSHVAAPAAVVPSPVVAPIAEKTTPKPAAHVAMRHARRFEVNETRSRIAPKAVTRVEPTMTQPAPQSHTDVAVPTVTSTPAAEAPKPELKHNEVIELYRTAEKALND